MRHDIVPGAVFPDYELLALKEGKVRRPIVGEFLKRYPSVQIRYLLLNETCCTKEIPNDAICRLPAHN